MRHGEFIKELVPSGHSFGAINHSQLKSLTKKIERSPYSIKYVSRGHERYHFDGDNFKVSQGQYLIVNSEDAYTVELDSKNFVNGICIYPSMDLIQEAYQTKGLSLDSNLSGGTTHSIEFLHQVTSAKNTQTGKYLEQQLPRFLSQLRHKDQAAYQHFFVELADRMVSDQMRINNQLNRHSAARKETKEELYRRVSIARDFLLDNRKQKLDLDKIVEISCLSKFHFLRSFKEFFGMTPYNYLLQFRLAEASKLRKSGLSYSQICLETGFSDPKNLRKSMIKHGFHT